MLNKYEVGCGDEFLGVYYGETEEEVIKECRSDFYWDSKGNKVTMSQVANSKSLMRDGMFARLVEEN